jgi:3',5'-cyclic AMP phosphodiesterase CpdA
MATGTAGETQRDHVARLLRETAQKHLFRVLYLHHCPVRGREKWRKRLTDAAQMQRVIVENGAELVVHGHGHKRQYQQLRSCDGNVPVIAVPSASAMGLHGADTAQYNHYGVMATEGGWELEINVRGYQKAYKSFAALESSTITLNRRHAKLATT